MTILELLKTNTLKPASEHIVNESVSSFWKKCADKYVSEYVKNGAIFNGVDGIRYDDLEYYLFELDKKWDKHLKEFKREKLDTLTREIDPNK